MYLIELPSWNLFFFVATTNSRVVPLFEKYDKGLELGISFLNSRLLILKLFNPNPKVKCFLKGWTTINECPFVFNNHEL